MTLPSTSWTINGNVLSTTITYTIPNSSWFTISFTMAGPPKFKVGDKVHYNVNETMGGLQIPPELLLFEIEEFSGTYGYRLKPIGKGKDLFNDSWIPKDTLDLKGTLYVPKYDQLWDEVNG